MLALRLKLFVCSAAAGGVQVSEEVLLTRGDEDEMKVKALEYAAPPGQRVFVKVRRHINLLSMETVPWLICTCGHWSVQRHQGSACLAR
jgi:hypothetical protein